MTICKKYANKAFTLIEIITVLSIISILTVLCIQAAIQSLESARTTQCKNHLKQLGIALASYNSMYNVFPPLNLASGRSIDGLKNYSAHCFSPSVRMLPQIEKRDLFDAVNFDFIPTDSVALIANHTVLVSRIDIFLCPSDRASLSSVLSPNNYRYCEGPAPWHLAIDSMPTTWSGPFSCHHVYSCADFQDGLSNTVGISERIRGDQASGNRGYMGYMLTTLGDRRKKEPFDWLVHACGEMANIPTMESRAGESWFFSGFHFSGYNHFVTPNSLSHDCSVDSSSETIHDRTMHEGIFSARSYHLNGVNVAMMDGSVRHVVNSINRSLWQAIATRSGGEVVNLQE